MGDPYLSSLFEGFASRAQDKFRRFLPMNLWGTSSPRPSPPQVCGGEERRNAFLFTGTTNPAGVGYSSPEARRARWRTFAATAAALIALSHSTFSTKSRLAESSARRVRADAK